jgi:hypothetical protein
MSCQMIYIGPVRGRAETYSTRSYGLAYGGDVNQNKKRAYKLFVILVNPRYLFGGGNRIRTGE